MYHRFILYSILQLSVLVASAKPNLHKLSTSEHYLQKANSTVYCKTDSTLFYLEKASAIGNSTHSDSIYINYLLLTGINTAILGEPETALLYFEKAEKVSNETANFSGLINSLLNIGETYYNRADFDTAYYFFNKSLNLSTQHNLKNEKAKALNYIGKYHHSKGDFDLSLKYYLKSYSIYNELKDTVGLISIQNKIGKHYSTLGNYLKALEYFLASKKLLPHINNLIEEASTYNHLGNLYQELKDFDRAMLFHHKALALREKMEYREGIAKSLKNIGEVFSDINQPDSAMTYFEKSIQICRNIGYTKGIVKNIHSQAIILKDFKSSEALHKFKHALEYSTNIGYQIGEIKALCELAELSLKLNNYKDALWYCKKGLAVAEQEKMKTHIAEFYLILSEIYRQQGKFETAFDFLKKQMEVHRELVNLESNNKISQIRTQYEMSLRERENEVLKKENLIQELIIKRKNGYILFAIIISSLLLLLIAITYRSYLLKREANDELKLLNGQLQVAKDQQVKLFSIISHELRNPLFWFRNLIQLLTKRIDSLDKAMIAKSLNSLNESATNTFHLMDNLLHWSRSQLGNLSFQPEPVDLDLIIRENINLINQYADQKNITIKCNNCEKQTVLADRVMLQTVIRNLLSNALKFTPNGGVITINSKKIQSIVEIEVCDSGSGMSKQTLQSIIAAQKNSYIPSSDNETGCGIGLSISKEFIECNSGELKVESSPSKGSTFKFNVPIYTNEALKETLEIKEVSLI